MYHVDHPQQLFLAPVPASEKRVPTASATNTDIPWVVYEKIVHGRQTFSVPLGFGRF
jgi:hypothetical protein